LSEHTIDRKNVRLDGGQRHIHQKDSAVLLDGLHSLFVVIVSLPTILRDVFDCSTPVEALTQSLLAARNT
jgi:hypothetical protein